MGSEKVYGCCCQLVAYGKDIADLDTLVQNLKTTVKGVKIEVVEDYKIIEKDWLLPDQLKTFPGIGLGLCHLTFIAISYQDTIRVPNDSMYRVFLGLMEAKLEVIKSDLPVVPRLTNQIKPLGVTRDMLRVAQNTAKISRIFHSIVCRARWPGGSARRGEAGCSGVAVVSAGAAGERGVGERATLCCGARGHLN
ncbi:unnamed protein product [Chilo suppressalis]|uniref:Uncharacterized protein n=1 Tax=Chilo suppressalis TaxID=168631 RepID=A0ABN8BC28_CHISP|nr:unnamed protein product [Chilo suppressalis]